VAATAVRLHDGAVADDHETLRLAVYRGFAATGRAPSLDELAALTGSHADAVREGLRELARQRHLVLDDEDAIVMAHPFSSVPLGFSVMGSRTLWWGGCSWDAFAIPHLVPDDPEVLVATRCPACGTPHAWVVGRDAPPHGAEVAHFLIPVARMWDDVVHTCGNQRIFCGEDCVGVWLTATANERGSVIDLPTLWRLAAGWYEGRLDPGYRRREPAEASAYFEEVGLTGAFWGLE
jgi:hypothetical protein